MYLEIRNFKLNMHLKVSSAKIWVKLNKLEKNLHKMVSFSGKFEAFYILFDFDCILALQSKIFIIVIKFLRFSHLKLLWVWNSSENIRPELYLSPKCHCVTVSLCMNSNAIQWRIFSCKKSHSYSKFFNFFKMESTE